MNNHNIHQHYNYVKSLDSTVADNTRLQFTKSYMYGEDPAGTEQKLMTTSSGKLSVESRKPEINTVGMKITDTIDGSGVVSNGKRYESIIAMGKTITLNLNDQRSFIPLMNGGFKCYLPSGKSNEQLKVASTSALDKTGSGGATSVIIIGWNYAYDTIIEVVTLNGQTPVTTTNSFYRLNIAQVYQTEDQSIGGGNKGDMYITANSATFSAGVPTNKNLVMASMLAGDAFFYQGTLSVPPGADIILTQVVVSMSALGKETTIHLRMWGRTQHTGSAWHSYANKFFTSDLVVSESNGFPSITIDTDGTHFTDFCFTVERISGSTQNSAIPATYFISGFRVTNV